MIYATMFFEFFKVGLFAIGGGMVTIPFLFELSEKYGWFSVEQLTTMIAVGESTPGPIGVNVATFAGYTTAGLYGGLVATAGLVMPSLLIIMLLSQVLAKYKDNPYLKSLLSCLRPCVIALILMAGLEIAKLAVVDYKTAGVCVVFALLIRFVKKNPVFYLMLGGATGLILGL